MIRRGFLAWVAGLDLRDWIMVVLVLAFFCAGIAETVDWLDQRSCRVNGGQVVRDGRDWRCERWR